MSPTLAPAPYVTIPAAAVVTGYTEKAIRRKIEDGHWHLNDQYTLAENGEPLISIDGYARWCEGKAAPRAERFKAPSKLPKGATHLYRHFDAAGVLLYVGISVNAAHRLSQHVRGAAWTNRIARVDVARYPTRAEAQAAERVAIAAEKPLYNIVHARKSA